MVETLDSGQFEQFARHAPLSSIFMEISCRMCVSVWGLRVEFIPHRVKLALTSDLEAFRGGRVA
jgi:hypothetical protein